MVGTALDWRKARDQAGPNAAPVALAWAGAPPRRNARCESAGPSARHGRPSAAFSQAAPWRRSRSESWRG
eukprot:349713-Pyramimonas_sp.AAC.1